MPQTIYKIITPRTIIRCYEENDAPALTEALLDSNAHLREWLSFAETDQWKVEDQVAKIRAWRSGFEEDRDQVFGIFDRSNHQFIGSVGYHKRVGAGGIEIGYWTRISRIRQGFMTEAVKALIKLAFEYYLYDRVEIHCQTGNLASAAIPKKLGFEWEATLKKRVLMSTGYKDLSIFSLFREDYGKVAEWENFKIDGFDQAGYHQFPFILRFGELDACCGL
ncbi:MAG TPA: GNAT family protein [Anaerolineales bacterium]|nr:GNAT family protein [Anaerolineales bacterium]